ncbi:hypothetical protein GWK47_007722 [Chionoecetes opilio]|uniref:Uncharacterized protein n=1 Tax=Chionoecetes opilio TaxID=41210 RepID=A0A8J4Y1E7_CHIOP|nr:hypothetical protein GWK47_007722 [Chionoecetes opilio]
MKFLFRKQWKHGKTLAETLPRLALQGSGEGVRQQRGCQARVSGSEGVRRRGCQAAAAVSGGVPVHASKLLRIPHPYTRPEGDAELPPLIKCPRARHIPPCPP